MRERFQELNIREAGLGRIEQANAIIEEYQGQGLRLTLRQLYYQLVARGLLPNTPRDYKNLGSLLNDGRMAGLVDWAAIEDRGRRPRSQSEWLNIQSLVASALWSYRLPRWKGQDSYAELWVEKDALAGVLEPLASEYHVTLMVNRGYSSASAMYESARRFIEACREDPDEDETLMVGQATYEGETVDLARVPVLFYLGDHDPSGEDMVRDIRSRLERFGVDVDVRKIALTTAQVEEFHPPENPVKLSDSRAEGYIRRHGRHCWEVDALPPNELARIVRTAFRSVVDKKKMEAVKAREELDKKRLTEAAKAL